MKQISKIKDPAASNGVAKKKGQYV